MTRLDNAIVALALECNRYGARYREIYDEDIANDGAVTNGMLMILQGLMLLTLLSSDPTFLREYIGEVGRKLGYVVIPENS